MRVLWMSTHAALLPLFPCDALLRSVVGAQEFEIARDVDYYPDGGPYQQDGAFYDVDFSDVQE